MDQFSICVLINMMLSLIYHKARNTEHPVRNEFTNNGLQA